MTTLPDRPHTALLVIDVQNGVVADAHDRDRVIANINVLLERARAQEGDFYGGWVTDEIVGPWKGAPGTGHW